MSCLMWTVFHTHLWNADEVGDRNLCVQGRWPACKANLVDIAFIRQSGEGFTARLPCRLTVLQDNPASFAPRRITLACSRCVRNHAVPYIDVAAAVVVLQRRLQSIIQIVNHVFQYFKLAVKNLPVGRTSTAQVARGTPTTVSAYQSYQLGYSEGNEAVAACRSSSSSITLVAKKQAFGQAGHGAITRSFLIVLRSPIKCAWMALGSLRL